jgi:hypothetical protein
MTSIRPLIGSYYARIETSDGDDIQLRLDIVAKEGAPGLCGFVFQREVVRLTGSFGKHSPFDAEIYVLSDYFRDVDLTGDTVEDVVEKL